MYRCTDCFFTFIHILFWSGAMMYWMHTDCGAVRRWRWSRHRQDSPPQDQLQARPRAARWTLVSFNFTFDSYVYTYSLTRSTHIFSLCSPVSCPGIIFSSFFIFFINYFFCVLLLLRRSVYLFHRTYFYFLVPSTSSPLGLALYLSCVYFWIYIYS